MPENENTLPNNNEPENNQENMKDTLVKLIEEALSNIKLEGCRITQGYANLVWIKMTCQGLALTYDRYKNDTEKRKMIVEVAKYWEDKLVNEKTYRLTQIEMFFPDYWKFMQTRKE